MSDNFDKEYKKLNPEQQQAVDTLEGPVMVIAGAGTGKTQTISLRIANILKKTDTPPGAILCLTYTDVAAQNMRDRLFEIIGPEAYKVRFGTFHSFCNEVILSHPQYFPFGGSALRSIDDLEAVEIVKSLIDKLKNNSPLIKWGDRYFYQKDINQAIHDLKRENISPEILAQAISQQEKLSSQMTPLISKLKTLRATKNNYPALNVIFEEFKNLPDISPNLKAHLLALLSSSDNLSQVKGAFHKFYLDLEKNIPLQKELVGLYLNYQKYLLKNSLYDYEDMILSVIAAFEKNSDLLLTYQEKYQYLLVDEFQDSNSSQLKIIDLLGNYFGLPNLFVVGDDDQSIYRFQGASLENLFSFYQKYLQPHQLRPIVLKNNYRSHRVILESSNSLISHNQKRLSNFIEYLDKSLTATVTYDPTPINLFSAQNDLEENYFIAQKIADLIKKGTKPQEIAILVHHRRQSEEIAKMLSAFKLKFFLPSQEDILQSPFIRQLLHLLQFISKTSKSSSLYHILNANFLNFSPLDLVKILRQHVNFSALIFDQEAIEALPIASLSKKKLIKFGLRIAKSKQDLDNYPLERFFTRLLKRFKIIKYFLDRDDFEHLNELRTLHDFLKTLSAKKADTTLSSFIGTVNLYLENKLPLVAAPLTFDSDDAIKVLTIHGAKGLEFEHVFLPKLIASEWEKFHSPQKIKLPFGLLPSDALKNIDDDLEDLRRLFYVALTRAKRQIYLSHALEKSDTKSQEATLFLSEIDAHLIEKIDFHAGPEALKAYYTQTLSAPEIDVKLRQYLEDFLTKEYKFNITHLNSYLKCPLCFYYTTILKIPQSKEKVNSFGTAVHSALSHLYLHADPNVLPIFDRQLTREALGKSDYHWARTKGHQILPEYCQHYLPQVGNNNISEYNFRADNLFLDSIPLTGKIDLIQKKADGTIDILDFKTGQPDNKSSALNKNGDYFRQIAFYKLLLSLKNLPGFKLSRAYIDFVEKSRSKNEFIRREIVVTDADLEVLKKQIKEVFQKISNFEFFEIGSQCRDPHHLHYLLPKNKS